MAMTTFDFDGADWTNPDPKDSQYIECLTEALKHKVSRVSSDYVATVNAFKAPTDNSGIAYVRSIMSDYDTILWDTAIKYYNHTEPIVTEYIAGVYDPVTGMITVSIRPLVSAGTTPPFNYYADLVYNVLCAVPWTVDKLHKTAGVSLEAGKLFYDHCMTDSDSVRQWMISRYKILKLLRINQSISFTPCFAAYLTYAQCKSRRATYVALHNGAIVFDESTAGLEIVIPLPDPIPGEWLYSTAEDINYVTHCTPYWPPEAVPGNGLELAWAEVLVEEGVFGIFGLGRSAPYSVTNADFRSEVGCEGPYVGGSYASSGDIHASWHKWTVQIQLSIRKADQSDPCPVVDPETFEPVIPFPESIKIVTPITLTVNDVVSIDGSTLIMDDRDIITSESFTEVDIEFGLEEQPPALPFGEHTTTGCIDYNAGEPPPWWWYLEQIYSLDNGYDYIDEWGNPSKQWDPKVKFKAFSDGILDAISKHKGSDLWV